MRKIVFCKGKKLFLKIFDRNQLQSEENQLVQAACLNFQIPTKHTGKKLNSNRGEEIQRNVHINFQME